MVCSIWFYVYLQTTASHRVLSTYINSGIRFFVCKRNIYFKVRRMFYTFITIKKISLLKEVCDSKYLEYWKRIDLKEKLAIILRLQMDKVRRQNYNLDVSIEVILFKDASNINFDNIALLMNLLRWYWRSVNNVSIICFVLSSSRLREPLRRPQNMKVIKRKVIKLITKSG